MTLRKRIAYTRGQEIVSFEYLEYTLGEGSFFRGARQFRLHDNLFMITWKKRDYLGKNAIILVKTRLFGRKSDYFGKKCDYL
jgi:hypothetical protein